MEAEMVTGSGRVVRVSLGLGKSHVQGAGICRSGEIAKTRTAHSALPPKRYLQLLPHRRYLLAKSASPEHQLALSVPPCSCLNTYILRPRAYEKEIHVLPTGKVPTLPKVR